MPKVVAFILAGGRGERFWPLSRIVRPKQLLNLTGDGSLLQETVRRLEPVFGTENLRVLTGDEYKEETQAHLPHFEETQFIFEPTGRNTAPAIALAAWHLQDEPNDTVMVVLPADHLVRDQLAFGSSLQRAVQAAYGSKSVVTLGVKPDRAETGYGYLELGDLYRDGVYQVKRFLEKPDQATADEFFSSGDFFWNSGIFIWRLDVIRALYEEHMKNTWVRIGSAVKSGRLKATYPRIPSISVDYGIMEHAQNVLVVPAHFDWDDVGSLAALERIRAKDEDGNVVDGDFFAVESKNCIVVSNQKLIAGIGLEDLIVVDTEDALLILPKHRAQEVRQVVARLRAERKVEYL